MLCIGRHLKFRTKIVVSVSGGNCWPGAVISLSGLVQICPSPPEFLIRGNGEGTDGFLGSGPDPPGTRSSRFYPCKSASKVSPEMNEIKR